MTTQDVTDFSIRSAMPTDDVLELDADKTGFLDALIAFTRQAEIYARLRKRYSVPAIVASNPEIILQWVAKLVTPQAYQARGVNPTDQALLNVIEWRKEALAQIEEAANSVDGLFDLPLNTDGTGNSITQGTPLFYAEASPFVWTDVQECNGRWQDRNGGGASG